SLAALNSTKTCESRLRLRTASVRMDPAIFTQNLSKEFFTSELCYIIETYPDCGDSLSIARARVEPGITTKLHVMEGIHERYIISSGRGRIQVGELPLKEVAAGDIVLIPAGVPQRITNIGDTDLIFYCVCTPPFQQSAYHEL